ncbi:hypothetical protein [Salinivibrio socompensis]|uniref:hypothetical protein n=1 Tax=Salinivibrio socompensis TaxID=1510206 RepID=UPI0004B7E672|nr:hypothetical protein [Salinivibrio socompensis]
MNSEDLLYVVIRDELFFVLIAHLKTWCPRIGIDLGVDLDVYLGIDVGIDAAWQLTLCGCVSVLIWLIKYAR